MVKSHAHYVKEGLVFRLLMKNIEELNKKMLGNGYDILVG